MDDATVEAFPADLGPLWVRSRHWELDDPAAGDVLDCDGIRIIGSVESAGVDAEGVRAEQDDRDATGPRNAYAVTGSVVRATDVYVDFGQGRRLAGVDVVLSVRGHLLQAHVPRLAAFSIDRGRPLTVRGELWLVARYEWDAFTLADTRRAWSVVQVEHLEPGDYLLLLRVTE